MLLVARGTVPSGATGHSSTHAQTGKQRKRRRTREYDAPIEGEEKLKRFKVSELRKILVKKLWRLPEAIASGATATKAKTKKTDLIHQILHFDSIFVPQAQAIQRSGESFQDLPMPLFQRIFEFVCDPDDEDTLATFTQIRRFALVNVRMLVVAKQLIKVSKKSFDDNIVHDYIHKLLNNRCRVYKTTVSKNLKFLPTLPKLLREVDFEVVSNPHSRSLSAYKYDVYDVAQWVTQEYPLSSFSGLLELKQQKLKRKQELKAQRQVRENKRKTKMDELLLKSNCLSLDFAQTTTPYKDFVVKGPMKLMQSCADSIQLLVLEKYMSSEINKQQVA